MSQLNENYLPSNIGSILIDIKKLLGFSKKILTTAEAAAYLGISVSTLNHYKSENVITYYKPKGKLDYFKRSDLDAFALQNKIRSTVEIEDEIVLS
jgi:excisionase family DNA binding protein